jgi:SAM-dependent methyltransferase
VNPHFVERKACPVCASRRLRELYRAPYSEPRISAYVESRFGASPAFDRSMLEGATYILRECEACGLIFQVEIPGPELMDLVYEKWIDPQKALHRRQGQLRFRGRIALELMTIAEFLGRSPEAIRVLDFGMGWGYWTRIAQGFGFQVFGYEVAESRVEHAQRAGVTVLSTEDLAGRTFDFINTEQVFEHLPDPFGSAGQLAALLGEDGILKISVPNGIRMRRRLRDPDWAAGSDSRASLGTVAPLMHINCFTHRTLVRLGRRAGLRRVPRPARLLYRYAPTWERFGGLARRTVGQHYRSLRRQETNVWFRRVAPSSEGRSSER